MDSVGTEIVAVLRFLLPGFVTAWVFHGLTPFPKPSQFERVVQALIFTIFIQVLTFGVEAVADLAGRVYSLGPWTENTALVWSIVIGLGLGLVFTWFANRDVLHRHLRAYKITPLTSYPTEWFCEFQRNNGYVVLHLTGSRRLYGWPEQWPSDPKIGHFIISDAEWLLEDNTSTVLSYVRSTLVPVADVEMVEFMDAIRREGVLDGKQSSKSATVAATS